MNLDQKSEEAIQPFRPVKWRAKRENYLLKMRLSHLITLSGLVRQKIGPCDPGRF